MIYGNKWLAICLNFGYNQRKSTSSSLNPSGCALEQESVGEWMDEWVNINLAELRALYNISQHLQKMINSWVHPLPIAHLFNLSSCIWITSTWSYSANNLGVISSNVCICNLIFVIPVIQPKRLCTEAPSRLHQQIACSSMHFKAPIYGYSLIPFGDQHMLMLINMRICSTQTYAYSNTIDAIMHSSSSSIAPV